MPNRTQNKNSYETEKLTFAAYLIATERAELIAAKPMGKGKAVAFILTQAPTSDDLSSYFNGTGTVPALRFAETINTLKSVSYEVLRCRG